LADLELSFVEKRKAVDRGIQENHLVELVMSNRQMVIFGFFSLVKSDSVKKKLQCKRIIFLKNLCPPKYTITVVVLASIDAKNKR
jgi:hypothetical protein